MKYTKQQSGFTAVELLVTLFIAAAFLMSGYQLYSLIMKDGGEVRATAKAGNIVYDYLQRYKISATNPCSDNIPSLPTDLPITVDTLSDVTITVDITCPYSSATSVSKVEATLKYGNPQQTVSNATYVNNGGGVATAILGPQGPLSPFTVTDDSSIGTVAWSTPNNAMTSDNTYSEVTIADNQTTHYLKATNFGFSIPTGATIDGILVEIEAVRLSGGGENWSSVKLIKNGVIGGANRTSAGSSISAVENYDPIPATGGATDLWGESWTPADINNSNFGVVASFGPSGASTTRVDHIRMTIYFTNS